MGAAAALAGGGMGLNFLAGVMKGEGTQSADDFQANQADERATIARGAAAQTDAQLRENLNTSLGNIAATRAAQGANPNSPTSTAILDRTSYIGDRSRAIQVGNILTQAEQDEADATYLRQSGDYALQMSYLGSAGSALGSLSTMKFGSGAPTTATA